MTLHFKDAALDDVAERANVAQFMSFGPELEHRFSRVRGTAKNGFPSSDLGECLLALLRNSSAGSINVRSYLPQQPRSHEFVYGVTDAEIAATHVRRLAMSGLYTIVNETIDVEDGGVSGVWAEPFCEFAPGDTPRAVEKAGVASFPSEIASNVIETVYGFDLALPMSAGKRIEFSVHPLRVGYENDHVLVWEIEDAVRIATNPEVSWPNRFSRFIGDKAFGLLVASLIGVLVPRTTVIGRKVGPFSFGRRTGTGETWLRTAPVEPVPGKYTTTKGWCDPFELIAKEDAQGTAIASVLAQESVQPSFSGAAFLDADGRAMVEGVRGRGDRFMTGDVPPEALPEVVVEEVAELLAKLNDQLRVGALEWVHDGSKPWIVQIHQGQTASRGNVLVPGSPDREVTFDVTQGLDALRSLIDSLDRGANVGLVLLGQVGVTSHFGDMLRKAGVPARIEASPAP